MTPSTAERLTTLLRKGRFVIIAFWVAVGAGLAYFILLFLGATTQQFEPPAGSQSRATDMRINAYFPGRAYQSLYSVFVQYTPAPHPASVSTVLQLPTLEPYFDALGTDLDRSAPAGSTSAGYFALRRLGLNVLADRLVSPSNLTVLYSIEVPLHFTNDEALSFGKTVVSAAHSVADRVLRNASLLDPVDVSGAQLYVGVNGMSVFVTTVTATVKKDMALMDAIVLPLAIIVMGLTLGSVRLLILPLATIGLTISVSFGIMYFVAQSIAVSATAPSLMMSLCIAMSIDYNLFILSRYMEETRKGFTGPLVVATVLSTAGHTILVSGLTLMLACLGLVAFPMNMLRSFGMGCGLSVAAAMLSSLTFGPALLLTFPSFFEKAGQRSWSDYLPCLKRRRGGGTGDDMDGRTSAVAGRSPSNSGGTGPSGGGVSGGTGSGEKRSTRGGEGGIGLQPRSAYIESDCSVSASSIGETSVVAPVMPPQPQTVAMSDSSAAGPPPPRRNMQPGLQPPAHQPSRSTRSPLTTPRGMSASVTATPMAPAAPGPKPQPVVVEQKADTSDGAGGASRTGGVPELKQLYHWYGRLLRFPWNALTTLVILGGVCALIPSVTEMQMSDDLNAYLARGTDFRRDWMRFVADYGYGFTEPYTLFFEFDAASPNASFASSQEAWDAVQTVVRRIVADTEVPRAAVEQFLGPMVYGGRMPSWAEAQVCLSGGAGCDPNMAVLWNTQVSTGDQRAALVTFTSTYSPTGNAGPLAYSRLQEHVSDAALNALMPPSGPRIRGGVTGVGPRAMDAIESIFNLFPVIIGVTIAVVFILVGIAFRTPVIPLRSVISIAVTEIFAFGLATLTYQNGMFEWLGAPAVGTGIDAVAWIIPIVAFTVIVGVALDYDVFIVTRVNEFYDDDPSSPRKAVQRGVWSTSGVITAAGVIMAIAFFGMLLSSTLALNMLGFFLVVAVLFDTFVVRTLLVPCIMSLLGHANWWCPCGALRRQRGHDKSDAAALLLRSRNPSAPSGVFAPNSGDRYGTTTDFSHLGTSASGAPNVSASEGPAPSSAPTGGPSPGVSPPRLSGMARVGAFQPRAPVRRGSTSTFGGDDGDMLGGEAEPSMQTDQLVPNAGSPRGASGSAYGAV